MVSTNFILFPSEVTAEQQAKIGVMFRKVSEHAPHFTGPASAEDAAKDVLQVVDEATIDVNGGILVSHVGNKEFL